MQNQAGAGHPGPLTFGCFLKGPVQLQVCGSRKDQIRGRAVKGDRAPCEAASAAPSLPPA